MTDAAKREIGFIKYISASGITTIQRTDGKIFHCALPDGQTFHIGQIVHFVADEQSDFASYVTPHTVRHQMT